MTIHPRTNIFRWLPLLLALGQTLGCASGARRDVVPTAQVATEEASVDIVYVLGHDQHRLSLRAQGDRVTGQSFLNRNIVDEAKIPAGRFRSWLDQVAQFTSLTQRNSSSKDACRGPFTVTLRRGTETRSRTGCRSTDEGSLGRLVQDGEILFYSQN